MCLIVLAWQVHPRWPLLLVAHRDEFRDRPSAALAWWPDAKLLAGRDLRAGGTWLGVNGAGSFAALTNVRGVPVGAAALSRGVWVRRALQPDAAALLPAQLDAEASCSGAFNLLHGNRHRIQVFHSPHQQHQQLQPGVHALSNAQLNTAWPKVRESRSRMRALLDTDRTDGLDEAALWSVLHHDRIDPSCDLPDTGIGAVWERRLAPPLILGPGYGTVSRTLLALGHSGEVQMIEQQLDAHGHVCAEVREAFVSDPITA
jgi:uncharacterized protein with NRDE domain